MSKEFKETGGNQADVYLGEGNKELLEGARQLDEIVNLSQEAGFAHGVGVEPKRYKTDEASLVRLNGYDDGIDEYLIGTTARVNHEGENGPELPYGTTVKIKAVPRGEGYSRLRSEYGNVESVYAGDKVRVDRPGGAVKSLTGERAVRANEILVKRTARKLGEATLSKANKVAKKAQDLLNKKH